MNKTVLVTGSSRGIGSACVKLFAQNGYNVVINYLNSEHEALLLKKELTSLSHSCIAIKADVSDLEQVSFMFDEIKKNFGTVDILVNNAGIAKQKLFTDTTQHEWNQMFKVNVDGMFNCSQMALPDMIRNQSGKIINVSSIWGMVGASCEVAYSTTKAAVIGFSKALAKEVGPSGITVNCVAPGVIATKMNNNLDKETLNELKEETPLCCIGAPEDVANTVLFLASNNANFITGQIISPNGGFVI